MKTKQDFLNFSLKMRQTCVKLTAEPPYACSPTVSPIVLTGACSQVNAQRRAVSIAHGVDIEHKKKVVL